MKLPNPVALGKLAQVVVAVPGAAEAVAQALPLAGAGLGSVGLAVPLHALPVLGSLLLDRLVGLVSQGPRDPLPADDAHDHKDLPKFELTYEYVGNLDLIM